METEYKYQVGEVVNETLRIVSQLKVPITRKSRKDETCKGYEVQSLVYLDAPTYTIKENSLDQGIGCSYKVSRKIYEGNSLWSCKDLRKYIIDELEAKTIAPYSNKKVYFKCPECNNKKLTTPNKLQKRGLSCTKCSNIKREHIYNTRDIVGRGTLKVVKLTIKDGVRAYEVQSLKYPSAPNYIVTEYSLKNGVEDSYKTNKRIFEGNSLYSVKWVRPYLVDLEQAKKIAPNYGKPIEFKCPECGKKKKRIPNNIVRQGYSCNTCSKGVSYGELAFYSYQEYFKLGYESQVTLETLDGRRVDFVKFNDDNTINHILEIQGVQHTDKNNKWYISSHKQDVIKRQWAKKTKTLMIEIDMRISTWNYFKEQINNCEYIPNIEEEDEEQILEIMRKNKRYPIKEIIDLYGEGYTLVELSKRYKVSDVTIGNILSRNNVEIRGISKRIKCLNTGEVFDSITKAREWAIQSSKIGECCRGKRNYSGKHPETGEKLKWEYVD